MGPTGRQNFGDAPGQIPKLIRTLCHIRIIFTFLTITVIIVITMVILVMVRLDFSLFYSVSSSCISFLGPCILMLAIYIKASLVLNLK